MMRHVSVKLVTAIVGLTAVRIGVPSVACAQAVPQRVDLLSLAQETVLALSAAPPHLRAAAAVYALTDSGFVHVRPGTNGFTCVVNRDHPLARKPTCYDAEGTRTVLPKVLRMGELFVRGVPVAEVEREVAEGFASGRYVAPSRPGVAYMLSPHIRTYDVQTGRFGTFPPHIMFYAPHLTNADVGWTPDAARERPWLPFVAYPGPHAFLVVVPNPPNGS